MNLPGIVFQRFIKFARRAAIRPVHPHFLLESDVCFFFQNVCARAHMRVHLKLFAAAKFLSEILYAAGKHRHDSRMCACVLLPPPADKYADISATASYSTIKMIKKGIDYPAALKCRNTYGNAPSPTSPALRLKSIRTPDTFFSRSLSEIPPNARIRTANSLPFRFKRVLRIKLLTAGHSYFSSTKVVALKFLKLRMPGL